METLTIFLAAATTLCIFSFLWRDNVLFRLVEHIFVGASAGWFLSVIAFHQTFKPNVLGKLLPETFGASTQPVQSPEYHLIIPVILGIMMLFRLSAKYSWISRFSISFIVGLTSGMALTLVAYQILIPQVQKAIIPLYVQGNNLETFSSIVLVMATVSCLFYFFFSVDHKGKFFGTLSKIGFVFLMISFGAIFGSTVMSRISLLIGRINFLLADVLHLVE